MSEAHGLKLGDRVKVATGPRRTDEPMAGVVVAIEPDGVTVKCHDGDGGKVKVDGRTVTPASYCTATA